jgi:hypothetical protein
MIYALVIAGTVVVTSIGWLLLWCAVEDRKLF